MHLFTHSLSASAAGTMWTLCFQAQCASFGRTGGGGPGQGAGSGNKDLRHSWGPGPSPPFVGELPGPELPCAPLGVAYGALSPTQEREPATHSRAHEVPEPGEGESLRERLFPKVNEEPALSLPTPPAPCPQLAQQAAAVGWGAAASSTSLRKRPSSRQMKYGAGEPLETICFQ